jgi:hypothetical protein
MNTDPAKIRADVEDILVDLPRIGPEPRGPGSIAGESVDANDTNDTNDTNDAVDPGQIEVIEAVGRRLEQAHEILVNALESVEKG